MDRQAVAIDAQPRHARVQRHPAPSGGVGEAAQPVGPGMQQGDAERRSARRVGIESAELTEEFPTGAEEGHSDHAHRRHPP